MKVNWNTFRGCNGCINFLQPFLIASFHEFEDNFSISSCQNHSLNTILCAWLILYFSFQHKYDKQYNRLVDYTEKHEDVFRKMEIILFWYILQLCYIITGIYFFIIFILIKQSKYSLKAGK